MITYLRSLLDLLLPANCLDCGRRGAYLCGDCLTRLPPAEPVALPNALAAFDYNDRRVKRAIWLLKYQHARSLAPPLGAAIYDRLIEYLAEEAALNPGLAEPWLLVPVPLSTRRERERGFNQAAVLAEAVVRRDPHIFALANQALKKIRETAPQVSLGSRRDRLENLRGAFALSRAAKKSGLVRGRNVIVIDDVITTGSTTGIARRVLERAGARHVLIATVAHG